ncbi:hypothetical protein [Streptosporangium longisporum]|uniref:Uncharacterized protein n=1 Tax=Streptosporangium longisporum TaxID=46187 RepID=A0ABP6LGE7_9ACTN
MNATLTIFVPPTDDGHDLLDTWVRPICARLGIRLLAALPGAGTAAVLAARRASAFVVWDCSVEGPEDVYAAFDMRAKLDPGSIVLSRTPLPRNVLTRAAHAPVHGETMENAELAEWLERRLRRALGIPSPPAPGPSRSPGHYWMFDRPADYFLSFHPAMRREAEEWRAAFEQAHSVTVRTVPPREYSYPGEVVTRQQMWEGVARLMYEIIGTGRVIVLPGPDHFSSFWPVSELLATLWLLPRGSTPPMITSAHVARSSGAIRRFEHLTVRSVLGVPRLSDAHADRFARLINNSDPITTVPRVRRLPQEPHGIVTGTVKHLGHHDPELDGPGFWDELRVPCPVCAPTGGNAATVDWGRHMDLGWGSGVDHYGHFTVRREELGPAGVRCPGCGTHLRFVNDHGVRTLWTPSSEGGSDPDGPLIRRDSVWQVLPDDRRAAGTVPDGRSALAGERPGRRRAAEARWIPVRSSVRLGETGR